MNKKEICANPIVTPLSGGGGACNPLIATVSGLFSKFACTGYGFAKKGTKLLRHYDTKGICHSELLAEESFLKGTRILRHWGSRVNLPLPTGEVDFVSERSEFTKSGEGSIFKVINGTKRVCHAEQLTHTSSQVSPQLDCSFCIVSASVRGETLKQVQGDNEFVKHVKGVMKKCAFTLSEVLIVLAVLGVIAAMTIPDLIQDYREKATVTAVKKAYTVLNQAVDMGVANNGPIESWDWGNASGQASVNVFRENIKPYLRIEKDCGTGTGCWYNGITKNLNGSNYYSFDKKEHLAKVLLADGVSLSLSSWGNAGCYNWKQCGIVTVDVNGRSNPNTFGKDVFAFYIKPEGVIPFGTRTEVNYKLSSCSTTSNSYSGWGCTAWVIEKENMDYLRETVSW